MLADSQRDYVVLDFVELHADLLDLRHDRSETELLSDLEIDPGDLHFDLDLRLLGPTLGTRL